MRSPPQWSGSSRQRAGQLWVAGLGARSIRKVMLQEGWHPRQLPNEGQVTKILYRDIGRFERPIPPRTLPPCMVTIDDEAPGWNLAPDDRVPNVPMEPDVRWFWSMKRCPICCGISDGDRCPQGHLFPGNQSQGTP